jgi:hypothetical protein
VPTYKICGDYSGSLISLEKIEIVLPKCLVGLAPAIARAPSPISTPAPERAGSAQFADPHSSCLLAPKFACGIKIAHCNKQ